MKFHSFHLMPYPDLPHDFAEKYRSVWVDVPSRLFDPAVAHAAYNEYLDELEYAAAMGFDGICVNEHHQNAYGLMPSPNLMAAALARRPPDTALVVLGNSLALYNPPTRVAEEFAMLDVLSGGRLVAGFPVGTSMDTNFAYGQTPITLRDKYREAHDLILKAWTEPEPFAWNGKFTQLRYVNVWPRPLQQPHPPIWVPGSTTPETLDWVIAHDYLFAYLSYGGFKRAKGVMDNYWRKVEEAGKAPNPYRAGFLQFVAVAEDDAQAEEDYAEAANYFYERCFHIYKGFAAAPGYTPVRRPQPGSPPIEPLAGSQTRLTWKEYVEQGNIIAGSPQSVIDQIEALLEGLHVGHLMLLLQFGNMPREKAMKNIRLFAEKVMPHLRGVWSDWEDDWWVHPLDKSERAVPGLTPAAALRR
jgi:alkanesulfonate monooxygenase SsuD/methylene tetrahydromethanopterin reductase-like flavin-dependent oxidoreductase (luciferase family)